MNGNNIDFVSVVVGFVSGLFASIVANIITDSLKSRIKKFNRNLLFFSLLVIFAILMLLIILAISKSLTKRDIFIACLSLFIISFAGIEIIILTKERILVIVNLIFGLALIGTFRFIQELFVFIGAIFIIFVSLILVSTKERRYY